VCVLELVGVVFVVVCGDVFQIHKYQQRMADGLNEDMLDQNVRETVHREAEQIV